MAYQKENVQELADKVMKVAEAFSDGFQLSDDSDEIMAVVPALVNASDEFKEDAASALMHLGARLLEKGADMRRAKADAEPPVE